MGVLFALPLLGAGRVVSRRPFRIELHVQLALASCHVIVLGLLFAAQGVPLNKNIYQTCVDDDFQKREREKKCGKQEGRLLCLHIGGGHQEKRVVSLFIFVLCLLETCEPGRPTHSAQKK